MAEMGWGPLKATPVRLLDFKSRLGYETQQWAALLSLCVPPTPHSQMHPNPLRVPASASPPPLPLLSVPPRRSVFCLLALSGHVVKPTALCAVASSPQSLSCLVSEMKVAISASTGSKPRFHGKRLAGRLERRKHSVSSFLPWTLSFPPLSVKSIPTPGEPIPIPATSLSNPGVLVATEQACPQRVCLQQPCDPRDVWLGSGGCQAGGLPHSLPDEKDWEN